MYISDMSTETLISLIWVAVFAVLVVIEAATMGLVTVWGAVAALVMVFIAQTGIGIVWQILIFLFITLGLLLTTRPVVVKKLKVGRNRTNVDTMLGEDVIVTKHVGRFEKGEARAKNGVIWAVTASDDSEIEEGAVCTVKEVQGNTLTIEKKA